MTSVRNVLIEPCFAVFVAAAACTGCTSGLVVARAASPALAPLAEGAPLACAMDGSRRVIAANVVPPGGVEAVAEESTVWLRFARKGQERMSIGIDPRSLEAVDEAREAVSRPAAHADFVRTAWTEPTSPPATVANEPGTDQRSSAVVVPVDSRRSVSVWTEGSTEAGLEVRVLTAGRHGEPLGDVVTLPHEGSAIGRPSVALTPAGHGVVAFLESNGRGFQVVAASLDCALPGGTQASQSWASRSMP